MSIVARKQVVPLSNDAEIERIALRDYEESKDDSQFVVNADDFDAFWIETIHPVKNRVSSGLTDAKILNKYKIAHVCYDPALACASDVNQALYQESPGFSKPLAEILTPKKDAANDFTPIPSLDIKDPAVVPNPVAEINVRPQLRAIDQKSRHHRKQQETANPNLVYDFKDDAPVQKPGSRKRKLALIHPATNIVKTLKRISVYRKHLRHSITV
jgi:hypothetical protein